MKNKKQNEDIEVIVDGDAADGDNINDEPPSSCDIRRKIEDLLEYRRYQDELGDFEDAFDLPLVEEVS